MQSCDQHTVEAMKEKYQKSGYKKIEIEGVRNKDGIIHIKGLADYSQDYIKSMTAEMLEANRALLIAQLLPEDQQYIRHTWIPKKD